MRVLITGGAGFIGSHLAEALLARGDDVLILDDLSTGSMENIRHLKPNPSFHYWIDTVMNRILLAELVDESDLVIHFAAAVGVRLIVESPVHTIETNVKGTELVLQAAQKKKKTVLVASTSEVMGRAPRFPSARMAIWSWARQAKGAGATQLQRLWTSSSAWPITARKNCR